MAHRFKLDQPLGSRIDQEKAESGNLIASRVGRLFCIDLAKLRYRKIQADYYLDWV
jgi:hypothetical protein